MIAILFLLFTSYNTAKEQERSLFLNGWSSVCQKMMPKKKTEWHFFVRLWVLGLLSWILRKFYFSFLLRQLYSMNRNFVYQVHRWSHPDNYYLLLFFLSLLLRRTIPIILLCFHRLLLLFWKRCVKQLKFLNIFQTNSVFFFLDFLFYF